jgi:hypothetical protein
MVIVVAWTETVSVWDGEAFAADLGRHPRLVEQVQPKACIWLNCGTEEDVQKAKSYAAGRITSQGYPGAVFTYSETEPDPLGRAKVDILAVGAVNDHTCL